MAPQKTIFSPSVLGSFLRREYPDADWTGAVSAFVGKLLLTEFHCSTTKQTGPKKGAPCGAKVTTSEGMLFDGGYRCHEHMTAESKKQQQAPHAPQALQTSPAPSPSPLPSPSPAPAPAPTLEQKSAADVQADKSPSSSKVPAPKRKKEETSASASASDPVVDPAVDPVEPTRKKLKTKATKPSTPPTLPETVAPSLKLKPKSQPKPKAQTQTQTQAQAQADDDKSSSSGGTGTGTGTGAKPRPTKSEALRAQKAAFPPVVAKVREAAPPEDRGIRLKKDARGHWVHHETGYIVDRASEMVVGKYHPDREGEIIPSTSFGEEEIQLIRDSWYLSVQVGTTLPQEK